MSTHSPEWELPSLFPQYAHWVSKGKHKHYFTCKVCQTNSLKLSNMGVEALKLHVKGNSKDGKKSKHKGNMYVLKTQSKILFKSSLSSENVVTKSIMQTETPLDPDPVQKTTDTA